jgi:acetate kinase
MDVIMVINSGSSSIKFHAFSVSGGTLDPIAGGKLEELYTKPHFQAKRQNGQPMKISATTTRSRSCSTGCARMRAKRSCLPSDIAWCMAVTAIPRRFASMRR